MATLANPGLSFYPQCVSLGSCWAAAQWQSVTERESAMPWICLTGSVFDKKWEGNQMLPGEIKQTGSVYTAVCSHISPWTTRQLSSISQSRQTETESERGITGKVQGNERDTGRELRGWGSKTDKDLWREGRGKYRMSSASSHDSWWQRQKACTGTCYFPAVNHNSDPAYASFLSVS